MMEELEGRSCRTTRVVHWDVKKNLCTLMHSQQMCFSTDYWGKVRNIREKTADLTVTNA